MIAELRERWLKAYHRRKEAERRAAWCKSKDVLKYNGTSPRVPRRFKRLEKIAEQAYIKAGGVLEIPPEQQNNDAYWEARFAYCIAASSIKYTDPGDFWRSDSYDTGPSVVKRWEEAFPIPQEVEME